MTASPFDLNENNAYLTWREQKLANYPQKLEELLVNINDLSNINDTEKQNLLSICRKTNMALFKTQIHWSEQQPIFLNMLKQLGITQADKNLGASNEGVSSLSPGGSAYKKFADYIPYRNAPIGWHTDGYYNEPNKQVRALTLLCHRPASEGGENELLDHEIVYILLRDQNPDYIRAFMANDVMTIPARLDNGKVVRPDRIGPVFSIINGYLHMRYTARTKSISWKQDELTQQALRALQKILNEPSVYKFEGQLGTGWGLISNNVLHTRKAFKDDDKDNPRKLDRIRFTDRLV
jgi:hypothetical protein